MGEREGVVYGGVREGRGTRPVYSLKGFDLWGVGRGRRGVEVPYIPYIGLLGLRLYL